MNTKRLPAEWEKQYAIMLTWPHAKGDWGTDYTKAQSTFLAIAGAIASSQQLLIAAFNEAHREDITQQLSAQGIPLDRIHIYLAPSNDVWARDHGPITFFEKGKIILGDFNFNAWGNKYESTLDNQITSRLFKSDTLAGYQYQHIDFVLEGGSIESDGQGTLLTTSQCLLKNRHDNASQLEVEKALQQHLGVSRVLWLHNGAIAGDDTDCHIDTLARFIDPETIAFVSCDNKNDPHYAPLQRMYEELKAFKTQTGEPYTLVPLPLPAPVFDKGKPLPAAYANFLITNKSVLVPTYNDPCDEIVLSRLASYFPNRDIVGINCLPIIDQFGSLHCLTMQIPVLPEDLS